MRPSENFLGLMCILLCFIKADFYGDFRLLARIFILALGLRSWAVREAITGVAQLQRTKGRMKIQASDLKSLEKSAFISNKRIYIESLTPENIRSA